MALYANLDRSFSWLILCMMIVTLPFLHQLCPTTLLWDLSPGL